MATSTANSTPDGDAMIGQVIGNRYAVERLIGRGGVGLVYLAHDASKDRQAVIKVLAPHWAEDEDSVVRFEREARAMARLSHPNVVKMYDHGRFQGRSYIVMEFIRGEPLRRYLGRRKRLPVEEFLPIMAQILLGVGYVHARGIIVRDIKPANIMVCEHEGHANHVKLLDFGLARLMEEEDDEITKTHVIGTAAYMSPEQIRGDTVDVRADMYALGVLFFKMLTGEQPISGDNDAAVLVNHVHGKPKSLAERLPKGHAVQPQLIELIERCLAKDPDDRPSNASEMVEALFEFVPRPMLERPLASDKSRAAADTYWAARMSSGAVGEAAVAEDENISAEWTRPLLRRAAETGQAPLVLAEAEIAAMKVARNTPGHPEYSGPYQAVPQVRQQSQVVRMPAAEAPPPRRRSGSGVRPLPQASTPGSGARPFPGPPPQPPQRRAQPRPITVPTPGGGTPAPMSSKPGQATIRVTAADARDAIDRFDEGMDDLEDRRTGKRISVPNAIVEHTYEAEISDATPIDMELVEEIDAVEELDDDDPGVPSEDDDLRAETFISPTLASEPHTGTDALRMMAPPTYVGVPPREDKGPRLGLIVAVGGLAALVLGGLSAYLVLGTGGDDAAAAAAPVVAEAGEDAAAEEASAGSANAAESPAAIGTLEVRALEGARVTIDGEERGPAPVSLELSTGEHRVQVSADGYPMWEQTIEVVGGANPPLLAELTAPLEAVGTQPEATDASEASESVEGAGTSSRSRRRPKTKSTKPSLADLPEPPKTYDPIPSVSPSVEPEPPKPKPKSKSDVFLDSPESKDNGIFLPVGQ